MPAVSPALTSEAVVKIKPPPEGQSFVWCPVNKGLGARVTAGGSRTWVLSMQVRGKTVRRSLGRVTGKGSIGHVEARRIARLRAAELLTGVDELAVRRQAKRDQKPTLADAVATYVKEKRRRVDGKPLAARTKADYLAMVRAAGGRHRAGLLYPLASRRLETITAANIKALYTALKPHGERRQTYAMEVLRAVLNYNGVKVADNPLLAGTAGAQRVRFAPPKGNPRPLDEDTLRRWWRAACSVDTLSAASLRIQLLTGMRPGEPAQCERIGDTLAIEDPKNRQRHVILMSSQVTALADKWPGPWPARVDKTMAGINAAAETPGVTPQQLRHTAASMAAKMFPLGTVKRLLNHLPPGVEPGDVTLEFYVRPTEAAALAAWQALADEIVRLAGIPVPVASVSSD